MRNKNKKRNRFDEEDEDELLSRKRRRMKQAGNGVSDNKSHPLKRQMKKLMDVIITYQDRYVQANDWFSLFFYYFF